MKKLGLRTRLTLIFSLVFAGILVLNTAISYRILKFRLDDNLREELKERAAGLSGYLHFQNGVPDFEYDTDDPDEAYFVETGTRYYQIFNRRTGELIDQSHELDLLDLETDPEAVQTLPPSAIFTDAVAGSARILFHNETIHTPDGQVYLLQIGAPRNAIDDALKQLLMLAVFVVPVGLALAAVASWWMAGRALRPIDELTLAAMKIGISDLDRRLPLQGTGDELDQLSTTFNDMFGRLAKAIGEMKQFTASISHELRTPLTILRGEAEVMLLQSHSIQEYRRLLASHLEEYDRLARLVNGLLTLARAEAGEIRMQPAPVDLASLTQYLVEQLDAVSASRQISLSIQSEGPVYVRADREWLESAILNLLDNAIKYNIAGGRIAVTVENCNREARLEIRDTGIGIAPESRSHIFERFYRADPSRSGSREGAGLGLSLVQWIVQQHGGRIEVESEVGMGSRFTICLPGDPQMGTVPGIPFS